MLNKEKGKNSSEAKIRLVKLELKLAKEKKTKILNNLTGILSFASVTIFFSVAIMWSYKTYFWEIIVIIGTVLFAFLIGWYWYNKYKKVSKKIAELEKELKRLKEELKE